MPRTKPMIRRSCGGTRHVSRTSDFWEYAKSITDEIVVSHSHLMDSPAVSPACLIKADVASCAGGRYTITFRVNGEDGMTVTYIAEVWLELFDKGIQVLSFNKVKGSERRSKALILGDYDMSDEKPTKGKVDVPELMASIMKHNTSSDADAGSSELVPPEDSRKIRIHGYNMLLNEIRSIRPGWSSAAVRCTQARKTASSTWKNLSEDEKTLLTREAARRLEIRSKSKTVDSTVADVIV